MTVTGLNIIGDLTSRRGLTEAARLTINAIFEAGYNLSFIEEPYQHFPPDQRDESRGFVIEATGNLYPVNLIFYGISGFHMISEEKLALLKGGKYTIAYWVWEFSTMRDEFREQLARVDEIWTATRFCHDCISQITDKPITILPHPIETPRIVANRKRFKLPSDRFVFLFIFDTTGSHARKNPDGLIDAFERAFGPASDQPGRPLLVIKARHIGTQPEYRKALRRQVAQVGGLLLEENLSRAETVELMACADAYVSLHRAEGFGLTMAEAMALGKPVIATGYSGNMDYMTETNSYPVGYTLRPVVESDHARQIFFDALYRDRIWAEPDLDQAARRLRQVVDDPQEAARRGAQAVHDIARYCAPPVVGQIARRRLDELDI